MKKNMFFLFFPYRIAIFANSNQKFSIPENMARQFNDPRYELTISPFHIYVKLRPETAHIAPLLTELNNDPEFTHGIFHIVALPVDICNNVNKTYSPLFNELVNVTKDGDFNERDVIYRQYELRDLIFETVNFKDPSNMEEIRDTLYRITAEQEEDIHNGIVRMLKASGGFMSSQKHNPHLTRLSIKEILKAAIGVHDPDMTRQIDEITDLVLNSVRMGKCVDAIEDTFGKEIWMKIDEQIRNDGNPETSDRAIFSFFRTGGIAFPPRVKLVKTPEDKRTKAHSRYIIRMWREANLSPRYITFEHLDSFAIYTWFLMNPGQSFLSTDFENNSFILAVIQALHGRGLIIENQNINAYLTNKQLDSKGCYSFQKLQQAMTNANSDIVDAFMPKGLRGRPAKDAEKPDKKQKAANKEKIRAKLASVLIDSNIGRDNGRFIPLPAEYIEICDEFKKDFHDNYLNGKPDWKFVKIFMPLEMEGDRYKLYEHLCSYLYGDKEKPEDRSAAAKFEYNKEQMEEFIKKYEEEIYSVSLDVYEAARRICEDNPEEGDMERVSKYISPEVTDKMNLQQRIQKQESELTPVERLIYDVTCSLRK